MNPPNFFAELKRRNVYQVAVAYAVIAWLLIQIATQVFPFFDIPNWIVRLVVLLLIVGFSIALVCSWAFEITPEGIKREEEVAPRRSRTRQTGRKLTALIIVVAALAAGVTAFRFLRSDRGNAESPAALAAEIETKSIAVLPFENLSEEKALKQARQALQDYGDDQVSKPQAEYTLAQVQARFGDNDTAIAALPHLLQVPAGLTKANLKLDPLWDPLRKDPRFEKLCQEPTQ